MTVSYVPVLLDYGNFFSFAKPLYDAPLLEFIVL